MMNIMFNMANVKLLWFLVLVIAWTFPISHSFSVSGNELKVVNNSLTHYGDKGIKLAAGQNETLTVDARCELCKFFMVKIETALENPGIIGYMNQTIYRQCSNIVPVVLQVYVCPLLTSELEKMYIHFVNAELSPQIACKALCTKGVHVPVIKDLNVEAPSGGSTVVCNLCKYITRTVDISLKKFLDKIKDELNFFCHHLTPPADKECSEQIVDPYAEFEAQVINMMSPDVFCRKEVPVC